jgi:hypothetical protein
MVNRVIQHGKAEAQSALGSIEEIRSTLAEVANIDDFLDDLDAAKRTLLLVEADVSRWKRVIGEGLRSQTDGRQASEIALAAGVLNCMLDLERSEYVRIV